MINRSIDLMMGKGKKDLFCHAVREESAKERGSGGKARSRKLPWGKGRKAMNCTQLGSARREKGGKITPQGVAGYKTGGGIGSHSPPRNRYWKNIDINSKGGNSSPGVQRMER